ncbi:unnamed protein product [Boreogadus saida]
MLPADCRQKIEMDDYVRSADCPWPPQDGDRHGGAFLTSSPASIKAPRYTDYSLATPTPNSVSLGPFPCPAQLPQTGHQKRAAMKQSYVQQSTQALDKALVASLTAFTRGT